MKSLKFLLVSTKLSNMLLLFLVFNVFLSFSQKEYPCLKGNCEDGFGMKRISDTYKYMGYHKNGKRHGLTISFKDDSQHIFIFNSKEGKSDGFSMHFAKKNNELKRIYLAPFFEGKKKYPELSIVYTDEGVRVAGRTSSKYKSTFLDPNQHYTIREPVYSKAGIGSLKDNKITAKFHRNYSTGTTDVVYKFGPDWYFDISTKPYKDRATFKTIFHWDKTGFKVSNKEFSQFIEIRDILSFPENLGSSTYVNDMGFTSLLKIFMN